MSYLFPSERALLYPQFETYRLHPLEAETNTASFPLPGSGATQSRVGYNAHHLSFKEVRARIGWDHLAVHGDVGIYIDKEWNVVGFRLDNDLSPTFTTLAQLPTPVSSSTTQPEYPSALHLSGNRWAISTGSGFIYVIEISSDLEGNLIARYDLPGPSLLRSASAPNSDSNSAVPGATRLLLSRTLPAVKSQDKEFELFGISIDPTHENAVDDGPGEAAKIDWRLVGGDLPHWTGWYQDSWVVLSGEIYRDELDTEKKEMEEERVKREKIDTTGKRGLGAETPMPTETTGEMDQMQQDPTPKLDLVAEEVDKEYPYSWKQTPDSVTITFPLPAGTSRSDIFIKLGSADITLSLGSNTTPSVELSRFLRRPTRQWWSDIDLESSTYTFNESAEQPSLEIDLAKNDAHTRWPSVFFPVEGDDGQDQDEEEEDEEVPETLDSETLAAVKASFDNIRTRDPNGPEPEGHHPAIPALLREEMDYDMDDEEDYDAVDGAFADSGSKVGREVFIGQVTKGAGESGVSNSWSKTTTTVLSTPLNAQTNGNNGEGEPLGLVIKSAVDGLLFKPRTKADNANSDLSKSPWEHIATSPALSFVLSSKRDIRLVRHVTTASGPEDLDHEPEPKKQKTGDVRPGDGPLARNVVLAFDAGTSTSGYGQGNVYIYYPPTNKTTAKQGVIGVSGGERGALLGVGYMEIGSRRVVVLLCEKELVILKDIL